jgi:uncharacterized protein YkwD
LARRALLGICIAAVTIGFACGPALASTVTLTTLEARVLQLVNCERTKRGLVPLHAQYNLMLAARAHTRNMATAPFFSHISPSGLTPAARAIAFGYTISGFRSWRLAENIAWGTGTYATPEQIVRGWMNSPTHRAIILTASLRDIGVGVVSSSLTPAGRRTLGARYCTIDLGRRIR